MAYSDFKTLEQVRDNFELTIVDAHLFTQVNPVTPSDLLETILAENIELASTIGTEKVRSELIIAPILLEVRRNYRQRISFFSGKTFNVDAARGLNGECDFMLSASPVQSVITAPVVTVVEAKNDNINSGLGQCVAQMLASWLFDTERGVPVEKIYGAVSTGTVWRFLTLCDRLVEIESREYYINQLEQILGILSLPFASAKDATASRFAIEQ